MTEKEPYRLKNWEYLRDVICSDPLSFDQMVEGASETVGVSLMEDIEPHVLLEGCGCVISQDGFESCLNKNREELAMVFREYPESPSFEKFLEALDKEAEGDRLDFGKRHVI